MTFAVFFICRHYNNNKVMDKLHVVFRMPNMIWPLAVAYRILAEIQKENSGFRFANYSWDFKRINDP